MNVEIGRSSDPETPASVMGKSYWNPLTDIMVFNGIEAISSEKYTCGLSSHLHVTMAPFKDAPRKIRDQGIIVKDAIARILSSANISRVVIKMSDKEMDGVKKSWEDAVKDADSMNSRPENQVSEEKKGE